MTDFMLKPIEQCGQRVITTAQLAEAYGTTSKVISKNFARNKERYVEGKHFYRLTGDALKEFFANVNLTNANKIRELYLWTERGILLHAKSLNTDKAWEVYELLTDNYFRVREQADDYSVLLRRQNELERRLSRLESGLSEDRCMLPEKSHEEIRWENAEYVMERLRNSGETAFTRTRAHRLCRKLKSNAMTEVLEILEKMNVISCRKEAIPRGRKSVQIIEFIKTERNDF